jgi:hypothetical protein
MGKVKSNGPFFHLPGSPHSPKPGGCGPPGAFLITALVKNAAPEISVLARARKVIGLDAPASFTMVAPEQSR